MPEGRREPLVRDPVRLLVLAPPELLHRVVEHARVERALVARGPGFLEDGDEDRHRRDAHEGPDDEDGAAGGRGGGVVAVAGGGESDEACLRGSARE